MSRFGAFLSDLPANRARRKFTFETRSSTSARHPDARTTAVDVVASATEDPLGSEVDAPDPFESARLSLPADTRFPSPSPVLPHLLLGDVGDAMLDRPALAKLRRLRVAVVVSCIGADALGKRIMDGSAELRAAPYGPDIDFVDLELADQDEAPIAACFARARDAIERARRAGGRALVHCYVGQSRSVAIVTAYLVNSLGWPLDRAAAHVVACRRIAGPNAGFVRRLPTPPSQRLRSSQWRRRVDAPDDRALPVLSLSSLGFKGKETNAHICVFFNSRYGRFARSTRTSRPRRRRARSRARSVGAAPR